MSEPIRLLSSMATKNVLAALGKAFAQRSGQKVSLESVGGVDATRRVQAGEAFDVVVLASDALDRLLASGHLVAGSKLDLARSGVAVAVRAGSAHPRIGDEEELRRTVLAARSIGYSTGPSGVGLARLFERWGINDAIRERIVTPPPGTAVGALVARGEVELGFQQLSELIHLPGIDVVGPLPAAVQVMTTFSAAVGASASQPDAARELLVYLASPEADEVKRDEGMSPA
jgi:molybdate transport system substrate-binding protein